jgi:hypothetical protein
MLIVDQQGAVFAWGESGSFFRFNPKTNKLEIPSRDPFFSRITMIHKSKQVGNADAGNKLPPPGGS